MESRVAAACGCRIPSGHRALFLPRGVEAVLVVCDRCNGFFVAANSRWSASAILGFNADRGPQSRRRLVQRLHRNFDQVLIGRPVWRHL